MEWALAVLVILLAAIAGGLAWQHLRLRRSLEEYQSALRKVVDNHSPLTDFPPGKPGIEELAYAVHRLAEEFHTRLSLAEAERSKLASILEQMTDGVLIADAQGVITFINPAARRMFAAPQAVGHRVVEVLRQYQWIDAWQRCRETGQPQSETAELLTRRLLLHLVILPDQQTGGTLLLAQDLTSVRRLESVRRDFISNVSHELRTPLASLKTLTETLRDGALDDPKVAPRFLKRIETEVDALTQMTQELLDLSRIESGQSPLEFSPVDPLKLLESSAERMRAQAERAGLRLELNLSEGLPAIQADASRLEQVLVNLIHNAIKFTAAGGELILSAAVDGSAVRFSLRDSGVGIPEEDLGRIFERFYKADRARSGGGTGLGLSIARHIIEAHGGRIWAESMEGHGSTFYFTIPAG